MTDYIQIRIAISPYSETASDLMTAYLADAGYESFVADEQGLSAYIQADKYDKSVVEEIISGFPMDVETEQTACELIKGRDWNEEWEKNYFQPILIGNRCVVHSTFHKDIPKVDYDIIIDPKMAFGTGHHSTTSLILNYLLEADLKGKTVIDMGTGTGILAILCAKRGATPVYGVEIDGGAYENALENATLNDVDVNFIHGDASELLTLPDADVFIANINRNIILADLQSYASRLKKGGIMILSGFYREDVDMIMRVARIYGLESDECRTDNNWTALKLKAV